MGHLDEVRADSREAAALKAAKRQYAMERALKLVIEDGFSIASASKRAGVNHIALRKTLRARGIVVQTRDRWAEL